MKVHKRLRTNFFGKEALPYFLPQPFQSPFESQLFHFQFHIEMDTNLKKNSGVPLALFQVKILNQLIRDPEVGTEAELEEAPM